MDHAQTTAADEATNAGPPELPPLPTIDSQLALDAALDSLVPCLSSLADPWQLRVASLQRVSAIVAMVASMGRTDLKLVEALESRRAITVSQLADRRSIVVKQACTTLVDSSANIRTLLESESDADSARLCWLRLCVHWFQHLVPNIPVTIKVISEAAIAALAAVIADIAPIAINETDALSLSMSALSLTNSSASDDDERVTVSGGELEYSLLYSVISACQHKHAAVRHESFKSLTTLINDMPAPYIEREKSKDASESAVIAQSLIDYKQHIASNTSVSSSGSNSEPSSPLPFPPSPQPAGSYLFHCTEIALFKGSSDSDAKTRASSRGALLAFQSKCCRERGERVSMAMPLSSQKMLEKDRQDSLKPTGSIGATSKIASRPSVKDRVKSSSVLRRPSARTSASGIVSPSKSGTHEINFSMGRLVTPPPETSDADDEKKSSDTAMTMEAEAVAQQVQSQASALSSPSPAPPLPRSPSIDDAISADVVRHSALLSKLLDLDTPILTDKMVDFLSQPNVMEAMLGFLLCPTPASQSAQSLHRAPPSNDSEVAAMKRSYNGMTLLTTSRSPALTQVLESKLPLSFSLLTKAFARTSHANLYHTVGVLTHLATQFPLLSLEAIISDSTTQSQFLSAFDLLHEPALPSFLLTMLAGSSSSEINGGNDSGNAKTIRERRSKLISLVRSNGIIDSINARITDTIVAADEQSVELCECAVAFLLQLIEAVARCELLTSLFAHCATKDGLIERLIAVNTSRASESPLRQRRACSSLLVSLIGATETPTLLINSPDSHAAYNGNVNSEFALTGQRRIPNPLFALRSKAMATMKASTRDIGLALIADTDTGSAQTKGFGTHRLQLLELLAKIVSVDVSACQCLTPDTWSVLLDWLVAHYPNNPFVQSLIAALLVELIKAQPLHSDTLRYLFVDCKMLSRLIQAYHCHQPQPLPPLSAGHSRSASARPLDSSILLLGANLRLTASLLPNSSFLFSHLASHEAWRNFQPELVRELLLQSRPKAQAASADNNWIERLLKQNIQKAEPGHVSGIDIGSSFAKRLGYDQEANCIAPAAAAVKSAKKKNKKKKKKAKKMALAAAEAEAEAEDSDEEDEEKSSNSSTGGDDSGGSRGHGAKAAEEQKLQPGANCDSGGAVLGRSDRVG